MIPLHVPPITLKEIMAFPREDYVSKLEDLLRANFNKENAVFTTNGRNAIYLALRTMKLKRDDEVLIPGYACDAIRVAIEPICRPVCVDIDRRTFNINPREIEKHITRKTRAILVAYLYGNPCEIDRIIEIARANNLLIIEDTAQALGGRYQERMLGSFGDFTVFSFRFTKDIALLRGGALLANTEMNADLEPGSSLQAFAGLFLSLTAMGQIKRTPAKVYAPLREYILLPFFKSNASLFNVSNKALSNYQCYLIYKQLGRIKQIIEKRREHARYYSEKLGDIVTTPQETENGMHTYFRYTIQTDGRDGLYDYCLKRGIEVDKMYDYSLARLPNSIIAGKNNLNIPVHHELSPYELDKIVEVIHEFKKQTHSKLSREVRRGSTSP